MTISKTTAALILMLLALEAPAALSPSDVEAITALDRAYAHAWLSNDPEAVMATFTEDARIVPSGMNAIEGPDAMRRFWWPDDGSTTTIDSYNTRIHGVRGEGEHAYAWGTGYLVFTYEKDGKSSRTWAHSDFVMIATKQGASTWKMQQRMWSNRNSAGTGSNPPLVLLAGAFRSLFEQREYDAARVFMAPDARRWWDSREGSGSPWNIGPEDGGPWAAWDDHFRSEKEILRWDASEGSATALVKESNDYFRLLERPPVTNEITYFFDADGRIEGLLIRGTGERPPGRTEEFLKWARNEAPEELAALMPQGEIDPSQPERYRRLLNRWREASGRSRID